jgi:probable HAF family extracellular repeat protein
VDAFDINDSGQIVGRGFIGGEMHAFVLTLIR